MKVPKKFLIIGLVVVLILGGLLIIPRGRQKPLEFVNVKRQDISSQVSSSGVLVGKDTIGLKFNSSGKIASINIKVGELVQKGQILVSLDNTSQAIALQQAQNTLRDKQTTVDKVLDDIHLFQYGNGGFANVGSVNETMTQRQARVTAEVARDNAFDGVKFAQKVFEDTLIISPAYGMVTQSNFVPLQEIAPTDLIFKLSDLTNLYFDADVDEADIGKIAIGLNAQVTLDTYPGQTFKGIVDQILPQTKTTSSGATVVTVRIKLRDIPKNFVNGLSGEALIIIKTSKNTLSILQEALREDNTVVVSQNNRMVEKKVEVGISSETDVEIKSGLNEGEKVLLNSNKFGK